jgi:hypothetical protein
MRLSCIVKLASYLRPVAQFRNRGILPVSVGSICLGGMAIKPSDFIFTPLLACLVFVVLFAVDG